MNDPLFFERCDLPGGAQLFHQYRDMPWCMLGVVIRAGHMHDPVGKEGTAHLLEHQVTNGRIGALPAMPLKDLQNWLHGQRLSASLGTTSMYWSRYSGCAENESFDKIAQFLSDLVFRPGLDGDFEREREIVRAERGHRHHDRMQRMRGAVERSVFGNHRRVTATGMPDDDVLDAVTLSDIEAYHCAYYAPVNVRFVTIGGLPLERVAQTLAPLIPEARADAIDVGLIPPIVFNRPGTALLRFARDDDRPVTSVGIQRIWRRSRWVPDEVDTSITYALRTLLHQRLREDLRVAYSVSVQGGANFDHATFSISTKVDTKNVDTVLEEIDRILGDEEGFRKAFAQREHALRPNLIFFDRTCGGVLDHAMSSVVDLGRIVPLAEQRHLAESVRVEEALAFIKRHLSPDEAQTIIDEQL